MTKKYYPDVSGNPDFPKIEENIISLWKKDGVFEKSVSEKAPIKDGKNNEFVFYDGPPFANGLPHYGHLLTGYVKDIFARYKTMQGKRVERRFGWDCHGLPAEMGAEKELGISGRFEIEKFGIDKFNDACRTSVMKYTGEWEQYVSRQARWVDFKNDYKTMDKGYMESVLWAFKQLWDKGLVYESMRVMPYSWACETPLSNFETRMDNSYRERTDKAITVAFELDEVPEFIKAYFSENIKVCKILAWTTTPWTLPSNLALAVGKEVRYQAYKKNDVCYILAENAENRYNDFLWKDNTDIIQTDIKNPSIIAEDLVGISYKPLFPYFASKKSEGAFKIIAADFVTDEDGTGVVHLAPGFGEDDFAVCKAAGIPLVCPVDNAGKFTAEIYDLAYPGAKSPELPLPEGEGRGEGSRIIDKYAPELKEFARELRKNQTDVETKLWNLLRDRRFFDYKFRRQVSVGKYIADFVCWDEKLIIELDGGQHSENKQHDEERTKFLENEGFRVLRFWNNEFSESTEGVLLKILSELRRVPLTLTISLGEREIPHPNPLPQGEGTQRVLQLFGRNVLETNDDIIKYLKSTHAWLKTEQYKHNYPHCWRTDTPLIYKAVPSWYVEVTKFKDRMVELNQEINWIPWHVKDGQFGKWLENARDWSISRNRYWGSPIPVWKSDNPKSKNPVVAFGSIAELEEFFAEKVEDLHRPFIDQLTKADDDEQPNNPRYFYRRVSDVFDCWFESGSMPYAQVHYPFENKDWFETHFPADFIVEYVAQTRGWFYTLMVLSTALFDRPPFMNVICHGVVMSNEKDSEGKFHKLSKRLRNYPDPTEVFDKYGADALRWFMVSSTIMHGSELYIDREGKFIHDTIRLYIKPIWNAYNFFTLYANADGLKAQYKTSSNNLMDKYILAKCKESVEKIATSMDAYDTPPAYTAIEQFFEVLNNWYIRRSKERFWKSEKDEDKQSAYDTLYTVLHIMCRAFAPLLPLVAEEIFQGIEGEGKSVHLQNFPKVSEIKDETQLIIDMDRVQDICNAALAIRSAKNIRVRQPLQSIRIATNSDIAHEWKDRYGKEISEIIKSEINVKEVLEGNMLVEDFAVTKLSINSAILGKRLPEKMKQILPASKTGQWKHFGDDSIEISGEKLLPGEFTIQLEPKPEYKDSAQALSTNDALVILDLKITDELRIEGVYRDLVRLVQQSRKEADLNIVDRIALSIETANEDIKAAVGRFNKDIAEQTLAVSVELGEAKSQKHHFEQKLEGENVVIGFKKVA